MTDEITNIDVPNDVAPAGETAEQKAIRLEAANAKLYARAKEAEAEAKALKAKPDISAPVSQKPSDILKADEFKLYRQGYTESQIDFIMHNGGAKALEDKTSPLYLGLEAARQQAKAEDAASAVMDSSGTSDLERKFTEEQMRAMPKEELEKMLTHTQN